MTRRRAAAGAAVVALVAVGAVVAAMPARARHHTQDFMITVPVGPGGTERVTLDATLYLPDSASDRRPVPAILLAHGFGGSKQTVASDAADYADLGYAVLAWSAPGFGRSGGQIHLDDPDWEVAAAQRLIDWLAARRDIARQVPGDPRVAAVGGSYGGALALLLAAADKRVDAIVPMITWNDLARSLLPEATGRSPVDGVFKRQWAGLFFGRGGAGTDGPAPGAVAPGDTVPATAGPGNSAPASAGPGDTVPATAGPGNSAPATAGPGDAAPGTAEPGSSAPSTPRPGSSAPGTAGPGNAGSAGSAGAEPGGAHRAGPGADSADGAASGRVKIDPQCGRFARDVCDAYLRIAATGQADEAAVERLRRSSPASVIGRITAPTLLVQGAADSLFPLSEADANARGIAANGTPVRVAWYTGGHDGGAGPASDTDRLRSLTGQWLDRYLRGSGGTGSSGDKAPETFTYSRITGLSATDRGVVASAYSVARYPGLGGGEQAGTTESVAGPAQRIASPPGGNPAALSSLPGVGGLASFVKGSVAEVPGQHADFYSQPLRRAVEVVGAPTVRVRAASATGEAVLFVKLYDVDERGESTLPDGLVAPIRLSGLPAAAPADPVTVTLPSIAYRFEAGHRLRITISSSDQAYATPAEPTVYTVAAEPEVRLPTVAGKPVANPAVVWRYVLAGLVAAVAAAVGCAIVVGRRRYRRAAGVVVGEHADTPLVVRGLRKEYRDGFVAVRSVDFTVRRNRVVGLLGPNGAGKTTALRVIMGLTRPTDGEVLLFGHRLTPGAAVLSRVGALVEGPGFLPHLSGIENLRLYWRATGRPQEQAHLDRVLEIAGLGTAVHRKVKTYSHGMKQRLAIAQAMLGLPELLVLDEPTDGLDPPQIAGMREVLRGYATDGRAVLVSSHLLAEVEQTCTEVVVMHKGLVVAAGAVEEVVGDAPTVQFDVSDPVVARSVLEGMTTVRSVASEGNGTLVVDLDGAPRSELVEALVRRGVGVERVAPRRRLEDAFLALVGGDTKASGER